MVMQDSPLMYIIIGFFALAILSLLLGAGWALIHICGPWMWFLLLGGIVFWAVGKLLVYVAYVS